MIIFRMYANVQYFKQSSNFRYHFLEHLETPRSTYRQICVCVVMSLRIRETINVKSINGLVFGTETRNADRDDKTKFLKGQISGAFAKLQKATVSFVKSVRPPARPSNRMEQLVFYWTDFHGISYLNRFRKSVEKVQVSLKSDKNNGDFT